MYARLKKTLAALTIAMVVGLAALGWWCGKLYTANVEQTAALSDVQTTASQLRTEIDDQSKVIDQLTEQLAQTNDGGLRRVQQLEAQLPISRVRSTRSVGFRGFPTRAET
jgi:uncharacterized protein HemX